MRKTFAFSILALALLLVSPAFADTCISFATYDCASHVTNNVHIVGQAGTGLPVGTTQDRYQLWVRGSGYSSGREHHSNGECLWFTAWDGDLWIGLEQRLHR